MTDKTDALLAQWEKTALTANMTEGERAVLRNCISGIRALAAPAAGAAGQGEVVAWCELTPGGKIAHFDGKPMIMVGPVGNEHHPHPLYITPPAASAVAVDPADWPECSGDPGCCPENEGYGCCKPNSEAVEDQPPHGFIKVRDAVRGVVSVNKVFPGDIIAEEYDTRPAAAVAVDEARMKVAMRAFWQSVEESGCHPPILAFARDTLMPRWVRAALTAAPGSAGGVEGVQATDHVRRLVGTLDEWRLRMSYSDSYVGEPQGLFKSTIESLARAVDPIYPPKQEPAHPLKGVCIHTSAGTFDESTPIEDLAQPRAERQEPQP